MSFLTRWFGIPDKRYPNLEGTGECKVCGATRVLVFSGFKDRNGKPVYVHKCPQGHKCPTTCYPSDFPYASCTCYCTSCGSIWSPV